MMVICPYHDTCDSLGCNHAKEHERSRQCAAKCDVMPGIRNYHCIDLGYITIQTDHERQLWSVEYRNGGLRTYYNNGKFLVRWFVSGHDMLDVSVDQLYDQFPAETIVKYENARLSEIITWHEQAL